MLRQLLCACALLPSLAAPALGAEGEGTRGEELFRKNCKTCHSLTDDGVRRAGPHLAGVIGRQVGILDGFAYSEALKDATFAWDADRLDGWLTNPQAFLPGTYMLYRQADPGIRRDIIDYLQAAVGGAGN